MSSPSERLAQILTEGRFVAIRELGEECAAELHTHAKERYLALEATIPQFRSSMNRKLFELGPPVLAIYQALLHDLGVDREPALRLAEDMLLAFYRKQLNRSPLLGAAMDIVFRLKPARRLLMKSMLAGEPGGFRFDRASDAGALLAFDVRECPLVTFARRHGVPEVVPMICRLDDLKVKELHGIELHRTGTLGTGAEFCDFRYVMAKK
ncbi:L-2-amino-thiazoline-4-carboxylic acid hydrolase [Sorangium sp. So ce1078]|uniref:L-2-amino-thiazoline-4-carboxylic acid hydrolase n=1 Tax=Sorangium sp. So ce1078 TaxID=3133329 RepID=UPI003F613E80